MNIITSKYRELYFKKIVDEVKENNGKILLDKENDRVVGLIVEIINNNEWFDFDFKAPKRGRITELVVSKNNRKNGIGTSLLRSMENFLKNDGCKNILLGVFGYNDNAIKFYQNNGIMQEWLIWIKYLTSR